MIMSNNKLVFGVIGNRFVGGATKEFECSNNKLLFMILYQMSTKRT